MVYAFARACRGCRLQPDVVPPDKGLWYGHIPGYISRRSLHAYKIQGPEKRHDDAGHRGAAFIGNIFVYVLDLTLMRYWIVVVSKEHIARGVAGGFMQANHGKPGPLKRMSVSDWVVCYSPKQSYSGNEMCQAFTAIGQVADDNVYQYKMADDFIPYRRNIDYCKCAETPIAPLIEHLDFIKNKAAWGYQFRFGFFEIPGHDFELIKSVMVSG